MPTPGSMRLAKGAGVAGVQVLPSSRHTANAEFPGPSVVAEIARSPCGLCASWYAGADCQWSAEPSMYCAGCGADSLRVAIASIPLSGWTAYIAPPADGDGKRPQLPCS